MKKRANRYILLFIFIINNKYLMAERFELNNLEKRPMLLAFESPFPDSSYKTVLTNAMKIWTDMDLMLAIRFSEIERDIFIDNLADNMFLFYVQLAAYLENLSEPVVQDNLEYLAQICYFLSKRFSSVNIKNNYAAISINYIISRILDKIKIITGLEIITEIDS